MLVKNKNTSPHGTHLRNPHIHHGVPRCYIANDTIAVTLHMRLVAQSTRGHRKRNYAGECKESRASAYVHRMIALTPVISLAVMKTTSLTPVSKKIRKKCRPPINALASCPTRRRSCPRSLPGILLRSSPRSA